MIKIDQVEIKNFKSLRDVNIELSNLTLITGLNSSGKSSFIQALLLLVQNKIQIQQLLSNKMFIKSENKSLDKSVLEHIKQSNENITLSLEGDYVSLGNKKDILYQEVFNEDIMINVIAKDSIKLSTSYNNELKINVEDDKGFITFVLNLFHEKFQYIKTDRVIPDVTFSLSETTIKKNLIGLKGEYTAHFLAYNKNMKIPLPQMKHQNAITDQLLENTSLWLGEISEGIDISASIHPKLQKVDLTYSYNYKNKKTNDFNPLNVGFGITYVLPIIVSLLKASPGDLLIIENPESHLHPAGQSKIAQLCAIASEHGVQIIVETHSDHFLNGLRVATKNSVIRAENSQIYYFSKEENKLETKTEKINIDENGKISHWPKGFFDEWDNQLDYLLGI